MIFFALILGYIIGLLQTGYIVGRIYGIDIREHGSMNAGMTNVNRTLGKLPALVVFLVDVAKAVFAYVFVPIMLFETGWSFESWSHDYIYWIPAGIVAGLGAILGHNFPFYLRFKGGKGIACTLGVILMTDLRAAAISFTLGILLVASFRYISLASLAITLVVPILLAFFGQDIWTIFIAALIGGLAWYMHRDNIKRLLSGTERKFP